MAKIKHNENYNYGQIAVLAGGNPFDGSVDEGEGTYELLGVSQADLDSALAEYLSPKPNKRLKVEILQSIEELESTVTPRRMREAIAGEVASIDFIKEAEQKIDELRKEFNESTDLSLEHSIHNRIILREEPPTNTKT